MGHPEDQAKSYERKIRNPAVILDGAAGARQDNLSLAAMLTRHYAGHIIAPALR